MKLLSLSAGGVEIESPSVLSHLTPSKVGFAGEGILGLIIQLMFLLAVILSLFYIIWGGIQWIMSGGEKQGVEAARAKITYAVIGLILTFFAFFIMGLIGAFFNVDLISPPNTTTVETPGGPH